MTGGGQVATESSKKAAAAKTTAATAKPSGPVMYVGPNMPKIPLVSGTHYSEMPPQAEEVLKELPLTRQLFLPILKSAQAQADIRDHRGVAWAAYQQMLAWGPGTEGGASE